MKAEILMTMFDKELVSRRLHKVLLLKTVVDGECGLDYFHNMASNYNPFTTCNFCRNAGRLCPDKCPYRGVVIAPDEVSKITKRLEPAYMSDSMAKVGQDYGHGAKGDLATSWAQEEKGRPDDPEEGVYRRAKVLDQQVHEVKAGVGAFRARYGNIASQAGPSGPSPPGPNY